MEALPGTIEKWQETGVYHNLALPMPGLDFCSNDYLGMAAHEEVRSGLRAYLEEGGPIGAPSSRLLRGHTEIHESCESFLAEAFGFESALLFSSGYLANLGVLGALAGEDTEFFSDALNHASLVDGMHGSKRAIFRHGDTGHLESLLTTSNALRKVIVTESLFSMDGDFAPLAEIAALARKHGSWLIVDEAHATGLYGGGRGLLEGVDTEGLPLISVHTGGKALGAMGAFVLSSRMVREFLVNRARSFIFTTALSPLIAKQLEISARIVFASPERRGACLAHALELRSALSLPLYPSPIVPISIPGNARVLAAAAKLQERGFDVRAIRAPTVAPGTERLRVCVKSFHQPEDIARLATNIEEVIHD